MIKAGSILLHQKHRILVGSSDLIWARHYISLFGQAAFLIPLILIFIALDIYNQGRKDNDSHNISRYLGFALFVIAACSILSIHFAKEEFQAGAGGLLGDFIASLFISAFSASIEAYLTWSQILHKNSTQTDWL